MVNKSTKPLHLRSTLLLIVALCPAFCFGADPSLTGFYIVRTEASVGSRYFDSQPYLKLGYIADKPDLPISRLETVSALGTCGTVIRYHDADDVTSNPLAIEPPCVSIQLCPPEAQVFETLTTLNLHQRVLLLIDGQPIFAPNIREPISSGSVRIMLPENSDAPGIKRKLDSLVAHPMIDDCETTPEVPPDEQDTTIQSPYYASNTLAQALKPGMSKEEVIAIFGRPPIEFATGEKAEYYCLNYLALDSRVRQKPGEYFGFQVLLRDNKLVKWSPVLSSTDPE